MPDSLQQVVSPSPRGRDSSLIDTGEEDSEQTAAGVTEAEETCVPAAQARAEAAHLSTSEGPVEQQSLKYGESSNSDNNNNTSSKRRGEGDEPHPVLGSCRLAESPQLHFIS